MAKKLCGSHPFVQLESSLPEANIRGVSCQWLALYFMWSFMLCAETAPCRSAGGGMLRAVNSAHALVLHALESDMGGALLLPFPASQLTAAPACRSPGGALRTPGRPCERWRPPQSQLGSASRCCWWARQAPGKPHSCSRSLTRWLTNPTSPMLGACSCCHAGGESVGASCLKDAALESVGGWSHTVWGER